MSSNIF